MVSPKGILIPLSFKVEFEAINNVVQYDAVLLALQTTKNMNIECLTIYGDYELVIRKIKNQCRAQHPRLRNYENEVWDLIDNFFLAFNIQFFPGKETKWLSHSLDMR